jgi:MurNAc alpha-1-phosphate uridylyltransferase
MKAMILAAGVGSRLKPLTNETPKALIEVGGYTMLELAISYLKKFGVQEIIINIHHFAGQIIEYVHKNDQFGINILFSDERNKLMDTGGAIVHASAFLDGTEPFLMMGVDVLTDLDLTRMIKFHFERKPLVTLAVKDRNTTRSLLFDENMKLCGWRDNRTGEIVGKWQTEAKYALGFSVIQIIQPEIFQLITEKGAFSIIDLYLRLMETHKILGFRHDENIWLEFGRADRIAQYEKTGEFRQIINSF